MMSKKAAAHQSIAIDMMLLETHFFADRATLLAAQCGNMSKLLAIQEKAMLDIETCDHVSIKYESEILIVTVIAIEWIFSIDLDLQKRQCRGL
jgi:hypothetical protein